MATAKGDMKGFFRQRKTTGGITKSKPNSKSTTTKKSSKSSPSNHSATFGSDVVQSPALISHGSPDLQDNNDGNEEVLRQFDLNMAYGPCLGMNRLDRWERAFDLGLNPRETLSVFSEQARLLINACGMAAFSSV